MHQKIRNSSRMTIEKRSSKRSAVQIQSALQAYRECFSYAAVLFYACQINRVGSSHRRERLLLRKHLPHCPLPTPPAVLMLLCMLL